MAAFDNGMGMAFLVWNGIIWTDGWDRSYGWIAWMDGIHGAMFSDFY